MLGGTTEASHLARRLADAGADAIFSYAGRTAAPLAQPLTQRVGGFGGVRGLTDYLRDQQITHLIDATHPFAAQISQNAIAAARIAGIPLLVVQRPPWRAGPGDRWQQVADLTAAAAALPVLPARVFLAIGRQHLSAFAGLPHRWLLRLVDDPTDADLPLTGASVLIARGPFDADADEALLRDHAITHLVAKNSGGAGGEAKLIAARRLGLPVVLIQRPALPPCAVVAHPDEAMAWLHQTPSARLGA